MPNSHQESAAANVRMRIAPVAHGKTDVGRLRGHNEDAFVSEPALDLFVVCDGMGGNNAGEVASALATTSLRNFFRATTNGVVPGEDLRGDQDLSEASRRLVMGVRKANADVFEISSTRLSRHGHGPDLPRRR
jgi:serine/threonine protein phosphatase PrpC